MVTNQVLLVLLHLILLIPLLHVLRHDDRLNDTKPPHSSNICLSILCTLHLVLRLLHSETGKSHYLTTSSINRTRLHVNDEQCFETLQRIHGWWIWYYYICPVAWTVYGLIVTQYGDIENTIKVPGIEPDPTVKWYVQNHFGYNLNFMAPTACILVAFGAFFAFMYAICIKQLNFQRR